MWIEQSIGTLMDVKADGLDVNVDGLDVNVDG
jgi:hypothetical protein